MFGLSIDKILILALLGLVIFGPEQLPRIAAQAGQALRNLRRLADSARADLSEHLGPEFADFDLSDLNPRAFVRKHLLDDLEDDLPPAVGGPDPGPADISAADGDPRLLPGEIPPHDLEAT